MITGYLLNIVIIFTFAILIITLGNKVRIPGIVGFILTGILIGPYGLGLIEDTQIIDVLAEIGIVFLLFTIGMQFSFRTLYEMRRIVLIGGSIQVLATIAVTMAISQFFGVPTAQAVFYGFLVCHSSTTITLKLFQDRGEIETPHARMTLGISLFQDIMSVPMLIALPVLGGQTTDISGALATLAITLIILFATVLIISVYVIPRFMNRITSIRNQEVFLLSIILICFVITYLASYLGLSLALGAFLAGLTLSESDYFHQAFASIIPFRDIFTSFFFISIGMLLNISYLVLTPLLILTLVIGVTVVKSVIASGAAFAVRRSFRTSILSGLALSNIGEFAFVLLVPGMQQGLFSTAGEQIFLAVTLLTMSIAPLTIAGGPKTADFFCRLPFGNRLKASCEDEGVRPLPSLKDHLVIVGYGLNGRNLAKAAKIGGIPFVVIDLNPETVMREHKTGENIFFGDATNSVVLSHANIEHARILVIVINDPLSSRAITIQARRMNPGLFIIVRTRFLAEVKRLRELGADEVIPEEFETSVEIFTRVLKKYLIPDQTIDRYVHDVRKDTYEMLRNPSPSQATLGDLGMNLPDLALSTLLVEEGSLVSGKTLGELDVRKEYGVSVLAIRRGNEMIENPAGDIDLKAGDEVITIGAPEKIGLLSSIFLSGDDQ
ncbi:MAG TPA: cation:proton antiporter [Methanoregulaceae archaeon]|nr:MAG: cation:proton antiporter [Methanolinea sp.]HON82175.1 cation:proton antiporter [Methanoregulaceae archaeon]HPD10916.1 cation:proton antiporter [Methanoregulaceae archaeon]HRT16061.1 cation:proton antiporter [Methanoregulaceae archaeon]HRU31567.1 cation:proton antiporter [Methanoregulaceae archaeon]